MWFLLSVWGVERGDVCRTSAVNAHHYHHHQLALDSVSFIVDTIRA